MIADLHSHTTASDGLLTPIELLERARLQGVDMLAITDHDTLAGYFIAAEYAATAPELIAGIELSCVWAKCSIHIVGLNVDPANETLLKGIARQAQAREERARMIAQRLEKRGFEGAYEGAKLLAGNGQLGRPHFAQFLLDSGYVGSIKEAFKKYLGAGKMGDVKAFWPDMEEVIGWIVSSGGAPVLAHPLHYKMSGTRLRSLVADFKSQGGQALEVLSGRQSPDRTRLVQGLCDQFELHSSCGSDFHRPGQAWCELGAGLTLPRQSQPVWALWA